MIDKTPELEAFYRELIAKEDLSHEEAWRIYDALYEEAMALGAVNSENIWDGFDAVLRIARALQNLERVRQAHQQACQESQGLSRQAQVVGGLGSNEKGQDGRHEKR